MKRPNIIINSDIKNILNEAHINYTDGVSYLTLLFYGLKPSYIPENLEKKILSLGIVNMDYSTNTLIWKIPLFQEGETGFEWVVEWMNLFKKVNPERRGVKVDAVRRMKKFFANNPSVRKDDVFKATEKYLSSIKDPIYCKKSHKFIYEADNSSMLLDYIESMQEEKPEQFEDLV